MWFVPEMHVFALFWTVILKEIGCFGAKLGSFYGFSTYPLLISVWKACFLVFWPRIEAIRPHGLWPRQWPGPGLASLRSASLGLMLLRFGLKEFVGHRVSCTWFSCEIAKVAPNRAVKPAASRAIARFPRSKAMAGRFAPYIRIYIFLIYYISWYFMNL